MAKHTLKILACEHGKILKYAWPFFKLHAREVSPMKTLDLSGNDV